MDGEGAAEGAFAAFPFSAELDGAGLHPVRDRADAAVAPMAAKAAPPTKLRLEMPVVPIASFEGFSICGPPLYPVSLFCSAAETMILVGFVRATA